MIDLFPKWVCKLLSYLCVFILGIYTYACQYGSREISARDWVVAGGFGMLFFWMSVNDKKRI